MSFQTTPVAAKTSTPRIAQGLVLNHSLTTSRVAEGLQLNHSLTTPRVAEGLQLNHSLTTPRVARGFTVNHSLTTPRIAEGLWPNHSLTVPRVARGISIGLVVAGLSLAPPALAHEGHGSCGAGAQAFTVPLAQAGQLDDVAVPLARAGEVGSAETVLHATYCEPR